MAFHITLLEAIRDRLPNAFGNGGGVKTDVQDRAARDLGKVDVAALDQYTPVAGQLPTHDADTLAKAEAVRALIAAGIGVTGPLTDAQLRASAVVTGFGMQRFWVTITCADGAAYTANQRMAPAGGELAEIANIVRTAGGAGEIVGVRASVNKGSVTPRLRLHLFNASNPTLAADRADWKELFADGDKRGPSMDLPALTTAKDAVNSDCSRIWDYTQAIPFVAADGSTSMWLALETLDGFTPNAGADPHHIVTVHLTVRRY